MFRPGRRDLSHIGQGNGAPAILPGLRSSIDKSSMTGKTTLKSKETTSIVASTNQTSAKTSSILPGLNARDPKTTSYSTPNQQPNELNHNDLIHSVRSSQTKAKPPAILPGYRSSAYSPSFDGEAEYVNTRRPRQLQNSPFFDGEAEYVDTRIAKPPAILPGYRSYTTISMDKPGQGSSVLCPIVEKM